MNRKIAALGAASAMMMASPALAATIVNLDATGVKATSQTVNLSAGIYTVSLISDLYRAWSARTPATPNWVDYYDYTIGTTTTRVTLPNNPRYATEAEALAAYSATPLTLSLTTATAVKFAIADDSFWDNAGGVSLSIAQAVPEPATWAMMLVGFFMTGAVVRSKGRTRRAALA